MVSKTTTGPGGKEIKKLSKQTYYVCNEENKEGEALRQSQLSFTAIKKTTGPVGEDTVGGVESSQFSLTTISEGQCGTVMSDLPGNGI